MRILFVILLPIFVCMLLLEIMLVIVTHGSDILRGKKVRLTFNDWFGED